MTVVSFYSLIHGSAAWDHFGFFPIICFEMYHTTEVVALTDLVLGFDERFKKKAEELKMIFSRISRRRGRKKKEDVRRE